jgi:SAM-dependent methyltransferase
MTATPARVRLARRLGGSGVEVGALDRPTPLPSGAKAVYADVLSAEEVTRRFPGAPVPTIRCDGERLPGLGDSAFDFLVANHVLEHVSDPLGALREWHRVVRDGGNVLLTLPDKRFTFDRPRRRTRLAHLLDDAQSPLPPKLRDLDHLLDWATHVERLPRNSPEWGRFVLEQVQGDYTVHNHVWIARDLLAILRRLHSDGSARFAVEGFENTARTGDEFVLLLGVRKSRERSLRSLATILLAQARALLEEPVQLSVSAAKRFYRAHRPAGSSAPDSHPSGPPHGGTGRRLSR